MVSLIINEVKTKEKISATSKIFKGTYKLYIRKGMENVCTIGSCSGTCKMGQFYRRRGKSEENLLHREIDRTR